jgi:hypothetical protein
MLAMFRNKVLVRAGPSSSSTPPPPFLLRQVSFSTDAPSVDIEILCCRLSRRHRLACLPQPPADALLVYQVSLHCLALAFVRFLTKKRNLWGFRSMQRCQSAAAAEAASEIAAAFLDASVSASLPPVPFTCSTLCCYGCICRLISRPLLQGW